MTKHVYFRADADSKIGLGHLTRCLAIASMLKERYECIFILKESAESAKNLVIQNNYRIELVGTSDLLQEASFVSNLLKSGDYLVIDGYNFTEEYFIKVKSSGVFLVLIDDFFRESASADAIINHAIALPNKDLNFEGKSKFYLGEQYAMLRPPFLVKARQLRVVSKIENIFICFGGADLYNVTLKTLKALESINCKRSVHLVMASTFPFAAEIQYFVNQSSLNVILYNNLSAEEMAELMIKCEIAIAPSSGLSYEICAIGMGFLGGYFIDNQKLIYNGFLQRGCLVGLNDLSVITIEEMAEKISFLLVNLSLVNQIIAMQRRTIDGNSSKNILNIFSSL